MMFKTIIVSIALLSMPLFVSAETWLDKTLGTPTASDQLLGIDDPTGTWSVQRYGIQDIIDLVSLSGAVPTSAFTADGEVIVGTGSGTYAAESGSTLRTSIGLGSAATRTAEDTLTDGANLPDGAAVKTYGDTYWGVLSGADPDQAAGVLGQDTDGANVLGDQTIRATDGSGNQWPVGQKNVTYQFPFTTSGAVTDWQPFINDSGMSFTITYIAVRSDTTGLVVNVDEFTSLTNTTVLAVVESLTADTAGTNVYTKTSSSIDNPVIETGHGIGMDFDRAAEGLVLIRGWYNANVD